jgi:regulator of replication initiation timing
MTVSGTSVGADAGQPYDKNTNKSISELTPQDNQQIISCPIALGREGLQTVSMTELYDTVYQPKVPIVDGLLYSGLYLFVGASKIGKSFFMAQLGYHVSMGLPLWEYPVNQGSVLYLALEDDYARIQRRLSRMFDVQDTDQFYFAIQCQTVNEGLEQQLTRFIEEHADTRLSLSIRCKRLGSELEKERKKAEQETNKYKKRLKKIAPLVDKVQNYDIEYPQNIDKVLPEAGSFESGKAYREKKAKPLLKKLVDLVRSLYSAFLDMKNKYNKLIMNYNQLAERNERLYTQVDDLTEENRSLNKISVNYERIKRVYGVEKVEYAVL